jgi:beta-glucosidase
MKLALVTLGVGVLAGIAGWQSFASKTKQVELGHRSAPLLTVEGLTFKDLNRNGQLDAYEDWRLAPEARAKDLVERMSLEELAGVMVHGTLPTAGESGELGRGKGYNIAKVKELIEQNHVNSFITRLSTDAQNLAHQSNEVQALAESSRWGIPLTISSDPRNHLGDVLGASSQDLAFSIWPSPPGLAALDDAKLAERFADVVRQEYLAVGIRESLAPQADLATEPRWARIDGTFGEDAEIAKRMVRAYVTGMQNGSAGLNSGSVAAVVKHWAGYGAAKDGWDGHNYYGRYATFPGENFRYHVIPFTGAFEAHVAAVMPTYSILQGLEINGKPLEQVGAGFNTQLLRDVLRGEFAFRGVVLSDWAITRSCSEACKNGTPQGTKPTVKEIAMPWGVENLDEAERFAKAINAGVDQIGGTEQSDKIVAIVRAGTVSETRVREAATKILTQKFEQGLFEQPYVDEARAARLVGNADFVREGQAAQGKAVVLLENKRIASTGKALLPVAPKGTKVYLVGVSGKVAESFGFRVVAKPGDADFAVVRAPAPHESLHPNYFFGSRQHEGRLWYTPNDPAYAEFLRASTVVPTVFVTTLERPLVLQNVVRHATAVLGTFGIADEPLLRLITGQIAPAGHLPFELPSSQEAVEEQKSDLPHDSKDPLFPVRFGLGYQ